jgi:hypothetical protein
MRTKPILPISAIILGVTFIAQSLMAATFIQNPSFELNYNETFPHYGPIELWTGGSGVNESSGPFHNTPTMIPDQARVAFMQGNGAMRQTITGLAPGQSYWLQFFYDARNCCGGTVDMAVRVGGTQIDRIPNIRATPTVPNHNFYYFRSVLFTAAVDTVELEFATTTAGDATAVIDAVTIVPRDAGDFVVRNPSFEASGNVPVPGHLSNLGGWVIGGAAGVNADGEAFADNGTPPDQDHVLFLEGQSSVSQVLEGLVPGSNYVVSFAYNTRSLDVAHLRVSAGASVLLDADVTAVGESMPYHTFSGIFTADAETATLTFEQTADGQFALLDDVRVRGSRGTVLDCLRFSPTAAELAPGQMLTVTVTVDARLTAAQAATIRLHSPNTNVAELVSAAEDGILSLLFDVGQTVRTFEIRGVGRGTIRVEIVDSAGVCTEDDVTVTVLSSFVRNASFESSAVPLDAGYGSIVAWSATGGTGLNNASGPFHDNGLIPDRRQVAFIQQAGSLSQQIFGLTPGQHYWLQFHYNARNCCSGTIDLRVRFGGTELISIVNVVPGAGAGYHFQNLDFVPANSTGLLEFVTSAAGDASLLLDAVSIVQRDPGNIVIKNPSFESTGTPAGVGYIQPDSFAGWTVSGNGWGPNLDGVGPFTDNGDAPDQDTVGFLQGPVSISQNVSGLMMGANYTLLYAVNARNCCTLPPATHHSVSFAGAELVNSDIAPVGGANAYVVNGVVFAAASTEGELRFTHVPPAGDYTLLLDNIMIVEGDQRPRPRLSIRLVQDVALLVRVSWPASATGYLLECNSTLGGGTWAEVPWPVQAEGDELFVLDDTTAASQKFYRLSLPPPAAGR